MSFTQPVSQQETVEPARAIHPYCNGVLMVIKITLVPYYDNVYNLFLFLSVTLACSRLTKDKVAWPEDLTKRT